MLTRLYSSQTPDHACNPDPSQTYTGPKSAPSKLGDEEMAARPNGHADRQMRDVQEFELEGLMSEDGDDEAESSSDGARKGKGRGGR